MIAITMNEILGLFGNAGVLWYHRKYDLDNI